MNVRSGITTILLLFVASSVVYLVVSGWDQRREARQIAEAAASESSSLEARKDAIRSSRNESRTVVVYYFHGNRRCQTCRNIEAYTEEAIRNAFTEELEAGEIEWHAVNVDRPENRHFIEDYQLSTRSVVLVERRNGAQQRWANLDQIWQLVRDKPRFFDYIQTNLAEFLGGSSG